MIFRNVEAMEEIENVRNFYKDFFTVNITNLSLVPGYILEIELSDLNNSQIEFYKQRIKKIRAEDYDIGDPSQYKLVSFFIMNDLGDETDMDEENKPLFECKIVFPSNEEFCFYKF